jgi:serine/threonine-protein kinase
MRPFDPDPPEPLTTAAETPTVPGGAPPMPTRPAPVRSVQPPPLRVLEEIGQGAMGVVYRAFDEALGREVAVKVLRAGRVSPERFRREMRALAQLRHPHVVPVYGDGTYHGQPCFTMPLLTGGTLFARMKEGPLDVRSAVALMEKVCRGVAAAHAAGIVHRDLKPGNVLLDGDGEPLVADFGLAKVADGLEETASGQPVGTVLYMSPEQAAGRGHAMTPAGDVWALGVMLYELLTGARPFSGTATEVTTAILGGRFERPRVVRPELPAALEAVVLRCLEVRPERRYADAGALADDLGRWLRGEPVAARLKRWWWQGAVVSGLTLTLALPLLAPLRPERAEPGTQAPAPIDLLASATLRPVVGQGRVTRLAPGGLKVESGGLTLIELRPQAPWERFVLRARAQNLDAQYTDRVGLYFAYTQERSAAGTEHFFLVYGFSERPRLPPAAPGRLARCLAELTLHRYRPPAFELGDVGVNFLTPAIGDQRFLPDATAQRRLRLEVTPQTIRAWWEPQRAPFTALFRDQWIKDAAPLAAALPPAVAWSGPPFPVRGGIGLICNGGEAVFEDVVLEPLRPDD